jgi:pimeloyl-ACP methyl ester carboxylesterase
MDHPRNEVLPPGATHVRRRRRRRIPSRLLAALSLAALLAAVAWWPWVVAQGRAVAVLAELLDVPVLQDVVGAVTPDPRVDEGAALAGTPTSVFRPGGDGPWPAVLFITGADEAGRRHADVVGLGRGLATAGFIVFVPDLPGMRDGRIGDETLEAGREVAQEAAEMQDVEDDQVALASVSAGASLALVLAADEEVRPHVSLVAGIAPYADVRTVMEIATTGEFRHTGGRVERFETSQWMRTAMARSLFAATDGSAAAETLEVRVIDASDPIAAARRLPPRDLRRDDQSGALALLRATTPDEFDTRYEHLPARVRDDMDRLSPVRVVDDLDMPIELASSPRDRYFPLSESRRLVAAAPNARLTVTSTLDHAIPDASLDDLGDLAAFDAFVVRVMRIALQHD